MAVTTEHRQHRNGALRKRAKHVREDMASLQRDLSQLRGDLGTLAALQWRDLRDRADAGAHYVRDQVRTHPIATIGVVAGAGLLAGLALTAMNGNGRRGRRH